MPASENGVLYPQVSVPVSNASHIAVVMLMGDSDGEGGDDGDESDDDDVTTPPGYPAPKLKTWHPDGLHRTKNMAYTNSIA